MRSLITLNCLLVTDGFFFPSDTQAVVIIVPLVVITLALLFQKEKDDFSQAVLSFTLSLGFTGVLTNVLKIIVGKGIFMFS